MKERVRFAPSPTGGLHLGGARTALYNWLVARHTGGAFVLRIEDTNASTVVDGAEASIMADLRWLGLHWDEGPDVGGPFGPYRQSERSAHYAGTFDRLRSAGAIYPCFCTPEALEADRAADAAAGRAPRYTGRCAHLSAAEVQARTGAGEPHVWRFEVRAGSDVRFDDAVFGTIAVPRADIGDFVLLRSDGSATYDLACVTDDLGMRITLVVRGADHLTNTARQILIYQALGEDAPRFAHLPLVTGPSGVPLSKSTGATSVSELAAEGHLPTAVVQHVALLGWADLEARPTFGLHELADSFALERVSRAPAAHDPARLATLTTRHLHQLSADELLGVARPYLVDAPEWLDRAAFLLAVRDDISLVTDVAPLVAAIAGTRPADADGRQLLRTAEGAAAVLVLGSALASLPEDASGAEAEAAVRAAATAASLPLRVVLPVLRVALTGAAHGLPIALLLSTIPRSECRARLERVLC